MAITKPLEPEIEKCYLNDPVIVLNVSDVLTLNKRTTAFQQRCIGESICV